MALASPASVTRYQMENNLKVAILMVTYNHGEYVRQAIESVVTQQTSFPFLLIIGEDYSTDNTRDICIELRDKYPDKIQLSLNEHNLGVARNAKLMHKACFDSGATYVAICEGDDRWTDPLKLQKQVEFLDSHPDHNICWTRYALETEKGVETLDWSAPAFQQDVTPVTLDNLFDLSRTYPVTVLWRRVAIQFDTLKQLPLSKDITLYFIALSTGKAALLNFTSANYRLHATGYYSAAGEFTQSVGNYYSLKEIIRNIPVCDTPRMRSQLMKCLERALFAACNQQMDANAFSQVIMVHKELFQIAPVKRKLLGIEELAKQSINRLRYKLNEKSML